MNKAGRWDPKTKTAESSLLYTSSMETLRKEVEECDSYTSTRVVGGPVIERVNNLVGR